MRRRTVLIGSAVTSALMMLPGAAVSAPSAAPAPAPSLQPAAGLGDPYYPLDGNRGYNVLGYHVRLSYFASRQTIRARTVVRAVSKERLTSVHLDLVGLRVDAVQVNGRRAAWTRSGPSGHELVVSPARAVAAHQPLVVAVSYHGKPSAEADGSVPSGWFDARTRGGGFIAGEPHSCTFWYPCNDHPTDKARFSLAATVPRPFAVVSVGAQLKTTAGVRQGREVRTFRWRLGERTATYLTTIYIDKLTFERSRLDDGTRVISAYGPDPGAAPRNERKLPEALRVLTRYWGPYPAPQAGGIFVSGTVPFSLETFTRPVYTEGAGIQTIVHENAHQWWGDNVSVKRWRDVCFNECLASYSQWLWDAHKGTDLDARYRRNVRSDGSSLFSWPLYDTGAGHEFDVGVYYKGKYFVHALRNKVGDRRFFAAMREIQSERAGRNMSMLELRDALERKTGVALTSFWREWVLETGRPSRANLFPGSI
ncbi:MAG: M1 family metallopeptidase [Nocardioidaceae bacterium]|nr:M1 family metallopeptidase [Nocardioidaceae bacterium]